MAEYHVGCGILGIYAGILNKKGDKWINKSLVTNEVLSCAFDYLYSNEKEFRATINGVEYAMRIEPITKEPFEEKTENKALIETDKTSALKAAEKIRKYCKSMPNDCEGCIFNKHDPEAVFFKGCLLDDNLPENWEIEKIKKENNA